MKRGPQAPAPPFEKLLVQVKLTNTLLAAQLLQHLTQSQIIGLLKGAGASLQDIADILGTSYGTVVVQSQRLRKKAALKGHVDGEEEQHGEEAETANQGVREAGDGPEPSE
jgi:DNA-binding CsgD family transcriptional regulator